MKKTLIIVMLSLLLLLTGCALPLYNTSPLNPNEYNQYEVLYEAQYDSECHVAPGSTMSIKKGYVFGAVDLSKYGYHFVPGYKVKLTRKVLGLLIPGASIYQFALIYRDGRFYSNFHIAREMNNNRLVSYTFDEEGCTVQDNKPLFSVYKGNQ